MGRTALPVSLRTGHVTKAEKESRESTESLYRGNTDCIEPPEYLTDSQREIFYSIVDDAKAIVGNIDVYLLSLVSISIDRLRAIETMINDNPGVILDQKIMQSRTKYASDFLKGVQALGLSPAARAKLAIDKASVKPKKKTLLDILKEDDDGDDIL